MPAFVDPFQEMDDRVLAREMEKQAFREKLAKFLKAFAAKDSDAVGQMRKDPQVEWIFQFTHYYDAANATPQRTTTMNNIELKYPSIPIAYNNGKLKAMLAPPAPAVPAVSPDVERIRKYGIATREDAFVLANGKGRRRTGRSRRGRGRRNRTKTRRL